MPVRGVSNDSGRGRWVLSVWLRNGSLEAIVAKTRRRDLAISGGVLLLMLATGAALAQFSRRAQQLAQVEMEFVAGVSHELRTPLTVIRTAAFNLRGKVASNPTQVERYGALIQQESERLGAIVGISNIREAVDLDILNQQLGKQWRFIGIAGAGAGAASIVDNAQILEQSDLRPDMVIVGKGLSAGVYPVAACCFGERVEAHFATDPFFHPSSYAGSELAARVVLRAFTDV